MSWNIHQKFAVLKSICFIIGANKKLTSNELLMIQGYLNRYELNSSAMKEQAAMTQFEMNIIISQMSDEDKRLIISYWKQAIYCDGYVDDKKVDVLIMMAEDSGIDPDDLMK